MATEFRNAQPLDVDARTMRKDLWWVEPLSIFLLFGAFVVYATFRVFENKYFVAPQSGHAYLSPFGTPDLTFLFASGPLSVLVGIPLLGQFLLYPAALILPFPAGFRMTCYYYRKAYYRSFWLSPPACAVDGWGTGSRQYTGERAFPLVLQNFHRYFLYFAILILFFLTYDVVRSVYTHDGTWNFGLGTVILGVNVALLAFYTLGCHSLRHLVGGKLDCFSCDAKSERRHSLWGKVTMLNNRHQLWALTSLVSVGLADWYVRWLSLHPGVTKLFGVIPV